MENEDKIESEQGQLARNMIACLRSLYVNSLKEILPFSHNYFDTEIANILRVILKKLKKLKFANN